MNLGAVYLCCAVLVCGANAQGGYEPTTDAEREISADCLLNLPPRAKYSLSLLSFDAAFFQVRETDLSPNENKFLEDCSTINVTNSSDTSAIRAIIEAPDPPVCYDVLFTAADGSAVVCGYLPIYASPIIDYEPATLEERIARHQCRQGLDIPDTFRFRPSLVRFEADPSAALPGYVLFDTTVPQDGDGFTEECGPIFESAGSNTSGAETRQVMYFRQTGNCHDVLFLAGGTDPVVCLYVSNNVGKASPYTPQTDLEQELESECKKMLPERNKYSAVLRQYPSYQVWETNTPNVDKFQEDCSTLNVVNLPDATLRDIVVGTEVEQICNDVLFYTSDSVPVACDYEPIFAEGITDYMPTTPAHRDIEKDCQENLPHPKGTRVALVEYEANPEGKFPGYHLVNVTYPNEGSPFREEDCSLLFNPPENATADPRPVILIYESSTCHDVLYFEGQNPVVCLYIIPNNATVVVSTPLRPAIVALTLTCLSVIASAILLITHFIFPSLQTLPSKVVMNLATAFLLGDIFYIIQLSLLIHDATRLIKEAQAIAVIAFYFFFARFLWMALSGFEMCRTIHVGTQLRFNSPQKRRQLFIIYLITGWSLPVIPTSIMAIVHYEKLESDFGESSLFGIGGYVVTLVPIGIVVLFNIGVVVYLTYVLYQARKWQVKVSSAISSNRRKTNFTRIFIIILSLLGVTWLALFLLYIDDVSTNESVQIIAGFFNTLQPIFVCVSFICTKKIYRKYKNLISGKPDEEVTDTSTVQNRFRNRRLLSFLFTDKELENSVPKYRFGRSATRSDSKLSNTSVSILMRDSTSNSLAPSTNGCSPPRDPPSLAPITEEMEAEEIANEESPNHVTVDLKDSTL